jgi:tetratricopeptide (TPR) repeat protein
LISESNAADLLPHPSKGVSLDALGRGAEAITCYNKALEINPELDSALKGRMLAVQRLGK